MKVTKRTWDVCRRCTFAEEGGGPKGKKTEREGEGRGRCTPQCGTTPDPIASSVSVLESSRSKRTSTDFGKRSLDNFLPHPFFPSGTNSRRYQEATKTSSNRIFRGYSQPKRKRIRDNRSKLHLLLLLFLLSFPLSREKIYFACKKLEMINRLNYIPCMGIERVHPFSKTVSPRTKRAVRSRDRAMYIYIKSVAYRERERERERGDWYSRRSRRSRRTNIGRFVGRKWKLDAVPDRGTKEMADKRGPVTEIGRRSGLGMGKVRGKRDTAGIP